MKKIILLLLLIPAISIANISINNPYPIDHYTVCFTPGGQCTNEVVNEIDSAKSEVLVQAYSFTSYPIAEALAAAKERGIDVRIILDKSQIKARYSSTTFFRSRNIPLWIDYKVSIAHNKVMIIDHTTVITGSFNFTKAAQYKNAENLLIIRDPQLARAYEANWDSREKLSRVLPTEE